MPQDSGLEGKGAPDFASAARQFLADAKADPIPDRLIQLARQLDEAIAEKRKQKPL